MLTTIQYFSNDDREKVLKENGCKYLLAEKNIREGSFLIFTDTKPVEVTLLDLIEDVNDVAELTTITAMDKDELAEMLVFALQRIDELEEMING